MEEGTQAPSSGHIQDCVVVERDRHAIPEVIGKGLLPPQRLIAAARCKSHVAVVSYPH